MWRMLLERKNEFGPLLLLGVKVQLDLTHLLYHDTIYLLCKTDTRFNNLYYPQVYPCNMTPKIRTPNVAVLLIKTYRNYLCSPLSQQM